MKKIKSVITLFLVLTLSFQLQAQWVGEKEVRVRREADNSQRVRIGSLQDSQDKSYEWRGPHIDGDSLSPVITVNPQDEREEYIVRRVSKCGVEEDMVVVILTDDVTLVDVNAKVECYAWGDTILKEDFDIITDPEDQIDRVVMLADKAMVEPEQVVPFYVRNSDGQESSKILRVPVYPIDTETQPSAWLQELADLIEKVQKIADIIEAAKSITDTLAEYATAGCAPSFDVSGIRSVLTNPPALFETCCKGEKRTGCKLSNWELEGALNYDCSFPIPVISYPPIAEVDVIFGFRVGGKVGPATVIFRGWSCISGRVPIDLYASVYGGVRVSIANPGFLSASLTLGAEARAHLIWDIGEDIHLSGMNLSMDIEGTMKVLGVSDVTHVTYNVGKMTLFND